MSEAEWRTGAGARSSGVPSLFARALAIETGRLDDLRIRAFLGAVLFDTATVNEQTATR